MSSNQRFSAQSTTFAIAATATASAPALMPVAAGALRIVNEGPSVAFVAVAAASTSATLPVALPGTQTATPVLPNMSITMAISAGGAQYISAICRAAGTAALSISIGEGS